MNIFSRLFLTAIFLFVSSHAVTAAESEACTLVKPPTTPVELLNNIKCVVLLNIVSEQDFYSNDKKLWELTAGQQVFRTYPFHDEDNTVSLTFFPHSIDNPKFNPEDKRSNYLHITFSKGAIKTPRPAIGARIMLSGLMGLQLSFADIENIFGHDWKSASDREMSTILSTDHSLSSRQLPTNEHGYQIIYYTLKAPSEFHAEARIEFDRVGMLQSMSITTFKGAQ